MLKASFLTRGLAKPAFDASCDEVLALDDVSFSYAAQAGTGTRTILRGAHLSIHRGNFVALMGANGAGKTTLLSLALGLLTPQQGIIRLFGEAAVSAQQRSRIAYVSQSNFQAYRIFPTTVEEVVRTHCCYLKKTRLFGYDDQAFQRGSALLDEFQLTAVVKSTLRELSGGQLQRLALLLSLLKNPQFLVLDEPTSGIDAQSSAVIMKHVARCCSEGMAVLMVTHHVDEVRTHATQLYRIEDMCIKPIEAFAGFNVQASRFRQNGVAEQVEQAAACKQDEQTAACKQDEHGEQVERQKQVVRHV